MRDVEQPGQIDLQVPVPRAQAEVAAGVGWAAEAVGKALCVLADGLTQL
ncbi:MULTISPECIES: hypothetical protein [Streptomyces]|uniref:Uncharacterized protein n=1 Tax=Streptomyces virginiae TaxID=1961 RepID=A0ABZ1T426_STRVG|nr:hypothetical protein [Streptomyces virginiae]WTB20274.1 hypothetical protein OG253_01410 [Streptomyces virginiae]